MGRAAGSLSGGSVHSRAMACRTFEYGIKKGHDNIPALRQLLDISSDDLCVRKLEGCLNGPGMAALRMRLLTDAKDTITMYRILNCLRSSFSSDSHDSQ